MTAEFKDGRCDYCKAEFPDGVTDILLCSVCNDAAKRRIRYLEWKAKQEKEKFDALFG